MIIVASFSKLEEAHLLRLRLEAGGVPSFAQDENMVQMDWMYSNAFGGVRVQIAEEDADRAKEIWEEPGVEAESTGMPSCAKCSSTDTTVLRENSSVTLRDHRQRGYSSSSHVANGSWHNRLRPTWLREFVLSKTPSR